VSEIYLTIGDGKKLHLMLTQTLGRHFLTCCGWWTDDRVVGEYQEQEQDICRRCWRRREALKGEA